MSKAAAAVSMLSPKALLVTPISPWGENFGAQQRTALLYAALSELMAVDVLLLDEGRTNEAAAGERSEILGKLSWRQPRLTLYKYGVHPWVDSWCHFNLDWPKYGLVVGRYVTPMTKVAWPRRLRTIVDCDDAVYRYPPPGTSVIAQATAAGRGKLRLWQTQAAIRSYDHAFFCSPRDRALFRCQSSSILSNAVYAPPEPPAAARDGVGTALFVGSMWYPPNRHGVEWFLERCWPDIAARCPGLSLRIVGPAPAGVRERWAQAARTEAPGFVASLAAEYARALFVIAPIHYGGGTCIKFLEAGAFSRPCVVTEHVFGGFSADFRDADSVVVGRDAGGMVEACVALYREAPLRNSIANRAHEIVTSVYTVERFKKTVQDAVRELMSPATARMHRAWYRRD